MTPYQKVSFCAAALVSTLASPALVNAYEQRSGWSCYPDAASAANLTYTMSGPTATGGAANLNCPIPDSTGFPHLGLVALNVTVEDGSNLTQATAATCRSFVAAVGGACGVAVGSGIGPVGVVTFGVPIGAWGAGVAGDYAYFTVNLPAPGGAGAFALKGYRVQ